MATVAVGPDKRCAVGACPATEDRALRIGHDCVAVVPCRGLNGYESQTQEHHLLINGESC
jgi:hypothetical protein